MVIKIGDVISDKDGRCFVITYLNESYTIATMCREIQDFLHWVTVDHKNKCEENINDKDHLKSIKKGRTLRHTSHNEEWLSMGYSDNGLIIAKTIILKDGELLKNYTKVNY